jgi:hypothetical protein
LAFLATAPKPFAFLATARTRPFIALLLTSPRYRTTPEIRPADLLRDPLGALLFVERLALEDFARVLRPELLRERAFVEPALRALPRERPFAARFVFFWAICPPS